MAIHLDIDLDVDYRRVERETERVARDVQREFQNIDIGDSLALGFERATPRIEKAASKAAKAADNLAYREAVLNSHRQKSAGLAAQISKAEGDLATARADGTADTDQLAKMEDLLNRRRITHANVTKQAAKAQLDYADASRAAADANRVLQDIHIDSSGSRNIAGLGSAFSGLGAAAGKAAGPAGIALAAGAIVELGGIAAVTVQSLWAIPAVLTAIGAGVGAAKIGFSGFGEAMESMGDSEAFAEALQNLSPSAQHAAVAIKALTDGPIAEMKAATQEALFAGVGDQLTNLGNTYLPVVQNMTVGIADAFNSAFSGLSDMLMQPAVMDTISGIADDIAIAFQNGAPAVASFAQALLDITSVGADFLPDLATGAADLAAEFAEFIGEARQSGELRQWLQDGLDALGEIGSIAKSSGEMFMELAEIGKNDLPVVAQAFRDIADSIKPIVETLQAVQNLLQITWDPLGGVKDLAEQFGIIDPSPSDRSPGGVGADGTYSYSGSFGTPQSAGRATTGRIGGVGGGAFAGAQNFMTTGWEDPRLPITGPPKASGRSGSGSKLPDGRVPNLANLEADVERLFGVEANADVGRQDSFGEHASGEALDIMVGNNRALGDQINRWILENADAFGLQYNLWEQASWKPDGTYRPMEDRGSATANHYDHVHARVRPGEAADGNFMPPGMSESSWNGTGTQRVSVESFGSSASSTLQQTIGSPLDQDFGFSKGLPGIFENLFKAIANLAMAPVLGALSGVTAAHGTAGSGSGLLGMTAPRTNAWGQNLPNIHGQYGTTSGQSLASYNPAYMTPGTSTPGLGLFSPGPNGAPLGTPASGVGAGIAPGPAGPIPAQRGQGFPTPMTPGASALQLQTGAASTPVRGIVHGQGVPASEGIGIGGGLIGAAQSMGGGMGGMGGAAMSAGAQIGIDLINRTIGFGGQLAGNAVGGLMETFLPVESELADPSRGWFGKMIGAVAGVRPAGQNVAGALTQKMAEEQVPGKDMLTPEQVAAKQKSDQAAQGQGKPGDINIAVNQVGKTDYGTGAEVGYHAAKAQGGR